MSPFTLQILFFFPTARLGCLSDKILENNFFFLRLKLTTTNVFIFSENKSNCGKYWVATVAGSFAWHFKRILPRNQVALKRCCLFIGADMLSPSVDPEVPMDFSTEYDASDKSSMDDSDDACTIPGSFSPDNNQDGASGDQRYDGKQKNRKKTVK